VSTEPSAGDRGFSPRKISPTTIARLKIAALVLTLAGLGLFSYFVYTVGFHEIVEGIGRIGFTGFAVILAIYFVRITLRAWAWTLSVYEPYSLSIRDTLPAVIIGESMSSMIPLGILVSGTTKALAVRRRLPIVIGLSSVATENLFYSLVTSLFLIIGAFTFLRSFQLDEGWIITIDVLIAIIGVLVVLGILMVIRQWHFVSELCEMLYQAGYARSLLENGRLEVRLFENLIYGFYRRYPRRFIPICLLELGFHLLGIVEGLYILARISDAVPQILTAFLLESISRLIVVVFKLVPFVIGIDEAGARYITETLAIGASVGVTLAIVRKGRVLFWTAVGLVLIMKRGISIRQISSLDQD
jgi:hypothetical protein